MKRGGFLMFSTNTNKKSKYLMAILLVLCVMLLSFAQAAVSLSSATIELYSDSALTKKVTNTTLIILQKSLR